MLTEAEEQPLLQNLDLILDSAPELTAILEEKFHEEKFHALSTPTMEPSAEPTAEPSSGGGGGKPSEGGGIAVKVIGVLVVCGLALGIIFGC
jgi:hypothetical protein